MKFWEIFRFEVGYQLRRPATWLYFAIFLVLTLAMVASFTDNVRSGDYLLNAPVVTAAITSIASLLALLVIAAVAGDAATHDLQERMDSLLYTAPISKFAYLGGRVMGAFAVNALVLLALPLGLMLAVVLPGIGDGLFGPFQFTPYISSFFLIALSNTFVATALLFSLALLSRHALVSFLGGVALFMVALMSREMLADHMGLWALAKQLDFSCFTIVSELRKTWAPHELNTRTLPLSGWLLWNRALWLFLACGFLAFAHYRFRFAHHVSSSWWSRLSKRRVVATAIGWTAPIAVPQVRKVFNRATRVQQTLAITFETFRENMASWGWWTLAGIAGMLLLQAAELLEGAMGVPSMPNTARITVIYNQFFFQMTIVAVMVVYVGQLVWRERDARLSDIADAAPVSNGVVLVSKLLSVALLLVTVQAVCLLVGITIQVSQGYFQFELGLYLRILFGLQLVDYLLFAVVAMAVHVLVNHKYLGHILIFVTFLYTVYAAEVGVENNLLVYGADMGWSYSDISGFGTSVAPWFWFKLYWAGWALLLALVARLFWVRGREEGIASRLRQALLRRTKPLLLVAAGGFLVIFTLGAFVFYNTHVLHEQPPKAELTERRATYERLYGKYAQVPQPQLIASKLHLELYPKQREAVVQGVYVLKNRTSVAIDSVHLATASGVGTTDIRFNRTAKPVLTDKKLRHAIYTLEQPLQPGDSLELLFKVHYKPKGFARRGVDDAVVANGSFFLNQDWLPAIGYQSSRELRLAADRRAQQLPPKPTATSLYEAGARQNTSGVERIRFEAVIGTEADQTAVTTGRLRKTWTENGRRYFRYVADAPIRNLYAFFSAQYTVLETEWQGVLIQVLHHPEHDYNAERMLESAIASLAYYTRYFGPYPHRQLRLVEYPGAGSGASAYPGTIALRESFTLLNPEEDWREMDLVSAVVAHEVAHQWWAHQLVPAPVEGAALLTESLAWYSALGVVEAAYGAEHLESLLWGMRQSYLTPNSKADVPLLRATNHLQAYRKGPFAMYALKEYVGEARINSALRSLLQKFGTGEPPLATSLDLYQELQAVTPDSLHYLLVDLFEKNTYWDLETKEAVAEQTGDGQWRVTLDVLAQKEVVDTVGLATAVPLHDLVEVGVYAEGKEGKLGELLYLQKHKVSTAGQRITVTVPVKPAHAGIDPRNLLLDVEMMDNVQKVSIQSPPAPSHTRPSGQLEQLMNFMLDTLF